jgi:hypothetical protein
MCEGDFTIKHKTVISQVPARAYNRAMLNVLLFLISSLLASFVAIDKFFAEYWFAVVVLAVHPVVMFNWTLWFLRTLRELRG